jgi:hypothetical protein
MKILSAALTLAVASVLAGMPVLAAQPPASQASNCPIRLDSTNLVPLTETLDPVNPGGFAEIAFTNVGTVPVTDVAFAIEDTQGSVQLIIRDHGNFSPGAKIDHTYTMLLRGHNMHVVVARVIFASGDVWNDSGTGEGPGG